MARRTITEDDLPDAYPLKWPDEVPRTPESERQRSRFRKSRAVEYTKFDGTKTSYQQKGNLTISEGIRRILDEVRRSGGLYPVISSNLQLRRDGLPYSSRKEPDDPGVALYFVLDGETICIPNDRYDRIADCMAAIAGHLDAMRSMLRWGCGTSRQAFSGYRAQLPPPGLDWQSTYATMSGAIPKSVERAKELHREVFAQRHPDKPGGMSHAQAARMNEARAAAIAALSAEEER